MFIYYGQHTDICRTPRLGIPPIPGMAVGQAAMSLLFMIFCLGGFPKDGLPIRNLEDKHEINFQWLSVTPKVTSEVGANFNETIKNRQFAVIKDCGDSCGL